MTPIVRLLSTCKLLQEDVFRGMHVEGTVGIRGHLDELPPQELLMVEKRGCRPEIDFDPAGTVDEIRAASRRAMLEAPRSRSSPANHRPYTDATPIEDRGDGQRDLDQIVSHSRCLERQSDADRRGERARGPGAGARDARRSRTRWHLDDADEAPPGAIVQPCGPW